MLLRSAICAIILTICQPVTAEPALAPYGFVRFCQKYPDQCKTDMGIPISVGLTESHRAELEEVNASVNISINAKLDDALDDWNIMPKAGDCDDYAVTKRALLIERGWPSSALRLAVVELPDGRAHLVLTVHWLPDVGKSILMLDNLTVISRSGKNLTNEIREFPGPYKLVKMQSADDPRKWGR